MFVTIYTYDIEDPINGPAVCRALRDKQLMHAQIQSMFGTSRQDSGTLYSVIDKYIIVKSDLIPVNDAIFTKYKDTKCLDPLVSSWKEGDTFNFEIITAPCASVHGKSLSIKDRDGRLNWLKNQFKNRGADVILLREGREFRYNVKTKKNMRPFCFKPRQYSGILRITDKDAFVEMYSRGIGEQKAYGNGMLVLS